jgi:hypothetical protein
MLHFGLRSSCSSQRLYIRAYNPGRGASHPPEEIIWPPHFEQKFRTDGKQETPVASGNGVADPVSFRGVEKQNLICLGDRLPTSLPFHSQMRFVREFRHSYASV